MQNHDLLPQVRALRAGGRSPKEIARTLGVTPAAAARLVRAAAGHLGPWTGPSAITFGNEGKPFCIPGPYDGPRRVTKTLDRAIGSGNYHFIPGGPVNA